MSKTQLNTRWMMGAILGMLCVITACTASDMEPNLEMKAISCSLQMEKSFSKGAEVLVTFSLKNQTETDLEVLQYHTPLEDLIGPVFEVSFEDEILSYQGPMVKRRPPTDEDWLHMKPSASLGNELDISRAWSLDKKGRYSLSLSQDVSYRESGSADVLSLPANSCMAVSFQIK